MREGIGDGLYTVSERGDSMQACGASWVSPRGNEDEGGLPVPPSLPMRGAGWPQRTEDGGHRVPGPSQPIGPKVGRCGSKYCWKRPKVVRIRAKLSQSCVGCDRPKVGRARAMLRRNRQRPAQKWSTSTVGFGPC